MSKPASNSKQSISVHKQTVAFSGPLPPPEVIEKYDTIVPGSAERIITMAEKEQEHRHKSESGILKAEILLNTFGLLFGFFVAIAGICVGAYIALKGAEIAGSVIGGVPLVALVGLFVQRNKKD